jgi:hypothetical protein
MTPGPSYRTPGVAGLLAPVLVLLVLSCTSEELGWYAPVNRPPDTWLTSAPPETGLVGVEVTFRWGSKDPEARVAAYEYVLADNGPGGFDPADTTGRGKWTRTEAREGTFTASATMPDSGDATGWRRVGSHTFFVRAVDELGRADPSPAYGSFTATTLAPEVEIVSPKNPQPGEPQGLPQRVTFAWEAHDEDGTVAADSVRWGLFEAGETTEKALWALVDTLHRRLEDPAWRPWRAYDAPDGSGRSALVTELEYPPARYYAFAVQAKDRAGAATPTFDPARNVRLVVSEEETGPLLRMNERGMGGMIFTPLTADPAVLTVPAGIELRFSWVADASADGQEITGYRYGWDIVDPQNPEEWTEVPGPGPVEAPPASWSFGQHLLLVEARDSGGGLTLARVQVNPVPFSMDRPILWVDDARDALLCSFNQRRPLAFCDQEHDPEWLAVLEHVEGFDPTRDVYDVKENGFRPPRLELLARYQNVVWNTGGVENAPGTSPDALYGIVRYVPWCKKRPGDWHPGTLRLFLAKGGHLWLSGWQPLSMAVPGKAGGTGRFPSVIQLDFADACAEEDAIDSSGVYSFPYRDVGLVALDRPVHIIITNEFRPDYGPDNGLFVARAINPEYPELDSLEVGNNGTIPIGIPTMTARDLFRSGYSLPSTGDSLGFPSTEIYDPQYWLTRPDIPAWVPLRRPEFIPLWRHVADPESRLMRFVEICGGWSRVHAWRRADLPGGEQGVMAKSLYMGFEPYFFRSGQFERVANYVFFKEWRLGYEP